MPELSTLGDAIRTALEGLSEEDQIALGTELVQGGSAAAVTIMRDALGALDADDVEGLGAEIATALGALPSSANRVAVLTSLLNGATAAEQKQVLAGMGTAPVVILTQAEYDAIGTPDADTLYAIAD